MRRKVTCWLQLAAPRLLAAAWAAWAAATAYAYKSGAPVQLQRLEEVIYVPIWVLWAVSAALLIVGAVCPAPYGTRRHEVVSWSRGIGLAITAGLIGAWAIEFMNTETGRGWVSGKNYIALAASALTHSWLVGRYRAPGPPEDSE